MFHEERVSKRERHGSPISRTPLRERSGRPPRVEWLMRGSLRVSGRLAGTPQCVGECRVSPASQGDQARGHQRGVGARTAAGLGGAGRGAARRPRGCRSRSVPASGLCPHRGPFVKTPSGMFLICVFSICTGKTERAAACAMPQCPESAPGKQGAAGTAIVRDATTPPTAR